MRTTILNTLHVTPATFFDRLFFDEAYNNALYEELGFASYDVTQMERGADGRITRSLKATPPVNAPAMIKKRLDGKLYYTETGTYDPADHSWTFASVPSVLPNQVQISGRIQLNEHAEGSQHQCDLEVRIKAWGIGGMIERVLEKNTRASFTVNTDFTNRYAREQGLT